jgi:ribosome-associated heat shock protein Hsp15
VVGAVTATPAESQRLDLWLWRARFHRSRAAAAEAAARGVRINGRRTDKPAAPVRVGDVLTFAAGGAARVVQVLGLGDRRGPAPEAQALYREIAEAVATATPDADPSPVPAPGNDRPPR